MKSQLFIILFIRLSSTRAKDDDLPLCPTNFQYFPQSLPMHCRMPTGAEFPSYPGMPGFPTMQPPSADKQPMPVPVPMPPGMPGPMPMPMPMPGPMMPMPGPMMPMPGPAPGNKLPVIVMPFYSPDTSHKKPNPKRPGGPGWKKPKRPHESFETSSDTDTSSDTSNGDSSSENGWWKGKKHGWRKNGRRSNKRRHSHHSKRRHNKKKKDLLTPVLQYVTNDGYVIYEKTISKGEAKNWLRVNKEEQRPDERNEVKNDEGLDASVHEERNIEVKEKTNRNKDKSREDYEDKDDERDKEDEKDKEEVTTQADVRKHHRKGASPAVNKLLPKRAF